MNSFEDLINMMLMSYPSTPESSLTFYSNQKTIQTLLLLVAVLCIPWMLLGKPIYLLMKKRRRAQVTPMRRRGEREKCSTVFLVHAGEK